MTNGLLGKKLGMTQVYDESVLAPVTVIEAGPCRVVSVKTKERDGYEAVQLSFGEVKEQRLSQGELGHLKKHQAPPSRWLREFPKVGDATVGQTIKVDMFKKGDWVDVVGVSKGKGFQGWFGATTMRVALKRTVLCSTARQDPSAPVRIRPVFGKIRPCLGIWGMSASRFSD